MREPAPPVGVAEGTPSVTDGTSSVIGGGIVVGMMVVGAGVVVELRERVQELMGVLKVEVVLATGVVDSKVDEGGGGGGGGV